MARPWLQVHASRVAVESLGKYHTVEGSIEFDVYPHVCFLALYLQMFNFGAIRCSQWPGIIAVCRRQGRAVCAARPVL